MNRQWLLRFVFVLSVIMMMSSTALSDTGNVWIRNSLPNQKDLIVHCKSPKDDMGYHRVHPRGAYNLLYKLRYEEYLRRLYENNDNWPVIYGKDMISSITKCLMFKVANNGKLEKTESIVGLRWCTLGMLLDQKLLRWGRVVSLQGCCQFLPSFYFILSSLGD